jgi:hypothetical protein
LEFDDAAGLGKHRLAGVDATNTHRRLGCRIVVGRRRRQPYVAHFDGISWRRLATPTLAGGGELTDVVALSSSTVVAAAPVVPARSALERHVLDA